MQIALTKKLSDAMNLKPDSPVENIDPLFVWTAGWTNTFDGRKEDMIVMVNQATRFTVAIYGIKWNQFKGISQKLAAAIRNTLLSMNLNPELVNEYYKQAGEIQYVRNHDRKAAAHIASQSLGAAFVMGNAVINSYNEIEYEDTLGRIASRSPVNYSGGFGNAFIPYDKMIETLTERFNMPAYCYRAFELRITLDLQLYQAVRRVIVPADIELEQLHTACQRVFGWKNYHLHKFEAFKAGTDKPVARFIPADEATEYDEYAVSSSGHKLSEFLSVKAYLLYTYDFGDCWEHKIELIREIPQHNAPSPYLLEAAGKTPPEDVGGVDGFIAFRRILLDTMHPDHEIMKQWAGPWTPSLSSWEQTPRVIEY